MFKKSASVVAGVLLLVSPLGALAQTSDYQSRIDALIRQIAQLTAVLTRLQQEHAAFTATPASGTAPLTVTFRAPAAVDGSYKLDFGDGKSGSFPRNVGSSNFHDTVGYVYTNPGTYTAKLQKSTYGCDREGNCGWDSPAYQDVKTTTITVTGTSNAPTLTVSANPSSVSSGQVSVISWSSTNATNCTAYEHGSSVQNRPERIDLNGSEAGSFSETKTYTFTCTGSGGSVSKLLTITVTGTSVVPPATVSMAGNVALNGVDQYVPLSQIGDSTAFTVSAWTSYSGSSCNVIFSDSTAAGENDVILGMDSSNIYIRADKNGAGIGNTVSKNASGLPGCHAFYGIPAGKNLSNAWHHIAWVNTGSQSLVYVDGVLVRTLAVSGSNVGHHSPAAQIGRMWDGTTGSYPRGVSYFNGKISDVRYYNSALSGSQVSQLYTSGMQYLSSTITPTRDSSTPSLATLTFSTDSSSPAYQIVAGGTLGKILGVFKFRPTGEDYAMQKIGLRLTSGTPGDLGQLYLYDSAGVLRGTASFVGNSTFATSTLSNPISLNKDLDTKIFVKGDISSVGLNNPGTAGDLIAVNMTGTDGYGISSGSNIAGTGSTNTAGVRIFRSFPTVTQEALPLEGLADGRLIRFRVSASSAGDVSMGQMKFRIDTSSPMNGTAYLYAYTDSSYSMPAPEVTGGLVGTASLSGSSATIAISPTQPIYIPPGSARYFQLRTDAPVGETASALLLGDATYHPLTSFSLGSAFASNNFIWSPNDMTTSTFTDTDWTNGFGVAGLPPSGISQTRVRGGTPTPVVNILPKGNVEASNCTFFQGWTYDPNASSTSIGVVIKEGDVTRASGTANRPLAYVNSLRNITGDHGFYIPTPASLKDGLSHTVRIYGVDTNGTGLGELFSNPRTLTCTTTTTTSTTGAMANLANAASAFSSDTAESPDTFRFTRNLWRGSRGAEVLQLQLLLTKLGFFKGDVTDSYGPLTEEAVKALQIAHNLEPVGSVGEQTRGVLNGGN